MRFCVTIVLTILLQFRLVWATEFSSGCNIFLTVATFNSTHDLTEYHVVIKENDIYLQSSHKTIALNPRSMKPSTALSNEDLKSSLELRKVRAIL
uniref:Uncharacterized protein n=1 Tax=Acrobeloides nanus TaxID=290746 RepID=A0A914BWX0_9BILA